MLPDTNKYLLFTNKKSYTDLRLVPKSLTLSDLERLPSGRHYALFHTKRHLSKPTARQIHCTYGYDKPVARESIVFDDILFIGPGEDER